MNKIAQKYTRKIGLTGLGDFFSNVLLKNKFSPLTRSFSTNGRTIRVSAKQLADVSELD
jgi:hypothetical protein